MQPSPKLFRTIRFLTIWFAPNFIIYLKKKKRKAPSLHLFFLKHWEGKGEKARSTKITDNNMKYQSIFILSNSSIILLEEPRRGEREIILEMPSYPCWRGQSRNSCNQKCDIKFWQRYRCARAATEAVMAAAATTIARHQTKCIAECRYVEHVVAFRFSVTEAAFFFSLIQYIVSFGFIATMFRRQLCYERATLAYPRNVQ